MYVGRIVSALTASVAVAGCAVVAIGMTRTPSSADASQRVPLTPTETARPAYIPVARTSRATPSASAASTVATPARAAISSAVMAPASTSAAASTTSVAAPTTSAARTTSAAAPPPVRSTVPAVVRPTTQRRTVTPKAKPEPKATRPVTVTHQTKVVHRAKPEPRGHALPLGGKTGSATRVITVDARSFGSTTATLQEWNKAPGGGWLKRGTAVTAHVGSDGLTRHASESRSATPVGSFTLTRAFGHDSDPGTALPYVHTTPASWWISQPGKLYNTLQTCSSHCSFNQGSPNEHLYYETPFYNYAVVIDYNTRNAPGGVHQGKGSAFFLHVTDGNSTAGCVSIPQNRLLSIMRWLRPSAHPRILIGVT